MGKKVRILVPTPLLPPSANRKRKCPPPSSPVPTPPLILTDDNVAVTADKIATLLKAANVTVEPFWPGLFANALGSCDVKELVTKLGSGVGSGAGAAPAEEAAAGGGTADKKKKEKEPEPEEEEEDDDMGFSLFD